MADFDHIARCLDLQEQHVAAAVETRAGTRALLGRLAERSGPDTGVAKVLLVYARLATTACDWIDGDLAIDLVGDGDLTVIEASTELGGGLRERLFPPVSFKAPLTEFARAIERVPHMIAPLAVRSSTARRISLSATEGVRKTSVPPPSIEISAESLYVRAPAPAVPRSTGDAEQHAGLPVVDPLADVDSGWDD
jgi:hypothetical protein